VRYQDVGQDAAGADSEALLARLWATPVGRRWVLKAGLGALAAAALPHFGPATARRSGASAPAGAFSASGLQFSLEGLEGVTDLVLVANGARLDLLAHTKGSRAELKALGGLWRSIDLSALTHYVPSVVLPVGRGMLLSVQGRRGQSTVVTSEIWHAPAQATLDLAQASQRLTGSFKHVVSSSPRLEALGLTLKDFKSPAAVVQLDMVGDSYQTATALTMTHPNIATVEPTATATTKAVLADTPPVQGLGTYIGQMQRGGRDFATMEQAVDDDSTPSIIEVGDYTGPFSTTVLNDSDPRFMTATKSSVSAGITAVRDTDSLGAVIDQPLDEEPGASAATWVQPVGVNPAPQAYTTALSARAGIDIKVKDQGFLFGTKTVVNGSYAGGKVPLRIYNNFVRWVWVYVQYLGEGGKNLSADPAAKFPDTKYAKSLVIVPQVFTVFGVPLWDTNTVEVSLEFPKGAHTARLLYCGLGSDIFGGGWRQYFPPEAYPDAIAPTDEVWVPALCTGTLCIGLNAFALASDIQLARSWTDIRKELADPETAYIAMDAVESGTLKLTAAEAFTNLVASGGATYLDIAHRGENINNVWNLWLGFATVVPKLLFTPRAVEFWADLAVDLLEDETYEKVLEAIPIIGQVFAIASAVGDVAALAQVGAETTISPWVIENEVNLTYKATVTVSRDPRSSTFPVTARTWRLEAQVDGAAALEPVAGTINAGGRTRSEPLALDVAAPFGGAQIQWSLVLLDGAGHQVGAGASPAYPNDDPDHPPAAVAFAITQLPAVVDTSTVVVRADTTAYSKTAGGYTWSDQVGVPGTVLTPASVDVVSTAVATSAGVAGVVWKEADRYYLRGVPLAQDKATIELGSATREGYARRPFLLLDPFVDEADRANHVLVEPDETSSAYHVRKVSLDPATGQLSWDAEASYGMFTLPVSAAALHSSGRVVAVNTDSGRLGWLQPVGTPRPLLAAYSAGAGTQVGLLSSPVALAVTNPGVVLVLEAASAQVSAFDLVGNPVRYFGDGPDLDFTLALVSPGTYLDIAVDGAEQVYLLYFTGTGATPGDYHVDVYTKAGSPLATHSPGVNVPHLAVDYWRSIYGANYSPLAGLGTTQAHIDPALGVPEPSLSRFDPT
jgi:hypothetical protein